MAETISEAELEQIFLIAKIMHYEDLAEQNYLVDHYIATGELPDACQVTENNSSLINDDIIS